MLWGPSGCGWPSHWFACSSLATLRHVVISMLHLRQVCGFAISVFSAIVVALTTAGAAEATEGYVHITDEIAPRSVTEVGEIFFQWDGVFESLDGRAVISSTPDGVGKVLVDDEIFIQVRRSGESQLRTLVRNYEFKPPSDPIDISGLIAPGTNRVFITLRDTIGGGIDSTALYIVPKRQPIDLVAGTGIGISGPKAACTNGPAVAIQGIRYHLTARHCFNDDGTSVRVVERIPGGDGDDAVDGSGAPLSDFFKFCDFRRGRISPIDTCIGMPGKAERGSADVIAWRPIVPVSNRVQVGPNSYSHATGKVSVGGRNGLRRGALVCAYGFTSMTQRCGPLEDVSGTNQIDQGGLIQAALCSRPGDSGGPAYVHSGASTVKIVGVVVQSSSCENAESATKIVTIDHIERSMGVRLLTSP